MYTYVLIDFRHKSKVDWRAHTGTDSSGRGVCNLKEILKILIFKFIMKNMNIFSKIMKKKK